MMKVALTLSLIATSALLPVRAAAASVTVNAQPDFPVAFSRLAIMPAAVPDGLDALRVERILADRLVRHDVKAIPVPVVRQAIFEVTGGGEPDVSHLVAISEKVGADAFLIPTVTTASSKTTAAYATGLWSLYSGFVVVGTIQRHQASVGITIIDLNGRVLMRGSGLGSTELGTFYGLLNGIYDEILGYAFNARYWKLRKAAEPIAPVKPVPVLVEVPANTSPQPVNWRVPSGKLTVAYRQHQNGELSPSVHALSLECDGRDCGLVTLTLNQCIDGAFVPRIESGSTLDGSVAVESFAAGAIVLEQKFPDVFGPNEQTVFKYRFEFSTHGSDDRPEFGELIGFSGVASKYSTVLRKLITWELVPLEGRFVEVSMDCPASLEGVPHAP